MQKKQCGNAELIVGIVKTQFLFLYCKKERDNTQNYLHTINRILNYLFNFCILNFFKYFGIKIVKQAYKLIVYKSAYQLEGGLLLLI